MTTLFENEFIEILRHDDIQAFEQRFKPDSTELFGESYTQQTAKFGDAIESQKQSGYDYTNLIINTTAGGPTMEPEVQHWMHTNFYPRLKALGIKTKAYCLGEEIISKLSVELTAEDDPNALFKFNFFATLEEGIDWLKIQNLTA